MDKRVRNSDEIAKSSIFTAFQRLMFAAHVVVIMTLKKGVLFLYLCIKSLKIPIPTILKYMVSLGKIRELDVLANLAKLCPACHRALKKGSSEEGFQKRLIRNILNRNKDNLEFVQLRFETDDLPTLINRIYESLK